MASAESSPIESEVEKGVFDKEHKINDKENEDIEEKIEPYEREPRSSLDAVEGERSRRLHPPLQQTRSRSSVRSRRSYTDGYSHFEEYDDEEKQNKTADSKPEEGKEFEVQFDGDADPWNPKSKPEWKKWMIVLIGSACSLVVTVSISSSSSYLTLQWVPHNRLSSQR